MKKTSTPLKQGALTTSASRGLPAPILDARDQEYQRKLGAVSEADLDKLIEGLRGLKGPQQPAMSFDELRDKTGL